MKPNELYDLILSTPCFKDGIDVDWKIVVDKEEKVIRLVFPGSNSKLDWIINFMFPVIPYKNQFSIWWACFGWVKAYKSCNDIIMDALNSYMRSYPSFTVQIIGHSLGGALSLLAAEDCYYRFLVKADVVTFGSPKVFFGRNTKKYITKVTNTVFQYANRNDLVTLVPPFFGYRHINKVKIGERFSLRKIFNVMKYHLSYGDESLYK